MDTHLRFIRSIVTLERWHKCRGTMMATVVCIGDSKFTGYEQHVDYCEDLGYGKWSPPQTIHPSAAFIHFAIT